MTPSQVIAAGNVSDKAEDFAWDLARQFPLQGEWTFEDYLAMEWDGRVEFVDGRLEFQSMTTFEHEDLVQFLFDQLRTYISRRQLGKVYTAPLTVQLNSQLGRQPDVIFLRPERIVSRSAPAQGADLVMEVVSRDRRDRYRDYEIKRREYAAADIPEYWIVDPEQGVITVLTLPLNGERSYQVHGEFRSGDVAASRLLEGFVVDVKACFAAGNPLEPGKEQGGVSS